MLTIKTIFKVPNPLRGSWSGEELLELSFFGGVLGGVSGLSWFLTSDKELKTYPLLKPPIVKVVNSSSIKVLISIVNFFPTEFSNIGFLHNSLSDKSFISGSRGPPPGVGWLGRVKSNSN